jgi:DNA-binding NarL/FixJ family response regulator
VRLAYSFAPMIPKMRILIVDADNLLRDGLCALLRLESDLEVVGTLDSVEAIANIAPAISPEIVILDIASPDSIGGAIARIRESWPETRIVVLTLQQDDRVLAEALRSGADAYALKSDSRHELIEALRRVTMGQRYISPAIHQLDQVHASTHRHQADGLTDRERAVMRHIARGCRTREIAQELSLSHKTIEKHRSSLMRKLGLKTATAVAAYAIHNGYLQD